MVGIKARLGHGSLILQPNGTSHPSPLLPFLSTRKAEMADDYKLFKWCNVVVEMMQLLNKTMNPFDTVFTN